MATFLYSIWHNTGTTVHDSRAWTLQERLLSPRSMVFAKTYLVMICQEEYFHDCLDVGPSVITRMGNDFFREDGADIRLDEPVWDFKIFDALVSVYSGRKLTVQTDALNACLGSLNRIADSTGYTFIYGHPQDDLVRSLLWKPHHEHVLTRRPEFPSWSWLGWQGRAEYPYWVGDMADYASDSPVAAVKPRSRSTSSSSADVSDSNARDTHHADSRPPTKRRRIRWFTSEDELSQQQQETSCLLIPSEHTEATSLTPTHPYTHHLTLHTLLATFHCKLIRPTGAPTQAPTRQLAAIPHRSRRPLDLTRPALLRRRPRPRASPQLHRRAPGLREHRRVVPCRRRHVGPDTKSRWERAAGVCAAVAAGQGFEGQQ